MEREKAVGFTRGANDEGHERKSKSGYGQSDPEKNYCDGEKQFYKMVFSLVLPMAVQNLINVGVTAADVIMLGRVGETALSAASLHKPDQFLYSTC